MTAETATALAEAFREHRDAFGVSITFGQTTITAVVGESEDFRELVEGGFAQTGDKASRILLADLPSIPVTGSAVSYNGRYYKVGPIINPPGSLTALFQLKPAKR